MTPKPTFLLFSAAIVAHLPTLCNRNFGYSVKSLSPRHAGMSVGEGLYDTPLNEGEVGRKRCGLPFCCSFPEPYNFVQYVQF